MKGHGPFVSGRYSPRPELLFTDTDRAHFHLQSQKCKRTLGLGFGWRGFKAEAATHTSCTRRLIAHTLRYNVKRAWGVRFGWRGFKDEAAKDWLELTQESVLHIHKDGGSVLGYSTDDCDHEGVRRLVVTFPPCHFLSDVPIHARAHGCAGVSR